MSKAPRMARDLTVTRAAAGAGAGIISAGAGAGVISKVSEGAPTVVAVTMNSPMAAAPAHAGQLPCFAWRRL